MKRATILLKKPCKSIKLLTKHAILCRIADFIQLKNLKTLSLAITMFQPFYPIINPDTRILKQNG